jgi:hypothetical protein
MEALLLDQGVPAVRGNTPKPWNDRTSKTSEPLAPNGPATLAWICEREQGQNLADGVAVE